MPACAKDLKSEYELRFANNLTSSFSPSTLFASNAFDDVHSNDQLEYKEIDMTSFLDQGWLRCDIID